MVLCQAVGCWRKARLYKMQWHCGALLAQFIDFNDDSGLSFFEYLGQSLPFIGF